MGWALSRPLFGVAPFEPIGALAASVVILVTGVLASLTPGWRATRSTPMEAMRE